MSRRSEAQSAEKGCFGRNCLAVLVVATAAAVVQMNVQPEPVRAVTNEAEAHVAASHCPPEIQLAQLPPASTSHKSAARQATGGTGTDVARTGPSDSSQTAGNAESKRTALAVDRPSASATSHAAQADPSADPAQPRPADQQTPQSDNVLTGRMALLVNLLMLEKSERLLKQVSDYTATFQKQERINGKLTELQVMLMKVRHRPFSIYMKWLKGDRGRQVLYVEGQNDNKMLVKFGGWKSRLPALKLDPNSALALAEARYPITKAGMLQIVEEILPYRRRDLQNADKVQCLLQAGVEFEGRQCYACVVEYTDRNYSPTYRKSILLLDQETFLPVAVKNFTWPDLVEHVDPNDVDGSTLLEYYAFTNVRLNQQLADSDFDRNNKAYRF